MTKITHLLKNTDTRVKTLKAAGNLLHLPRQEQSNDLLAITETWFSQIPSQMDFFCALARQPFSGVRLSVFEIYKAMAEQEWGHRIFKNHPGFLEYLLDRSTETEKKGKEEKYEIVAILSDTGPSYGVFDERYQMRLKVYKNEGPFYVRTETAVALEECT